ncbi:hypothetical protein WICPIJ_006000 [Wickerhamomyces pijperi]|uniref:Uncharacterized protein n=1 Tax=Wickerhamomyces pijperi TaxID=599730 RepID=A0A9P8TLT6_WICPI|nr:hypothetical protein WICPIJ_006000 [Wickerhamomyces pijperi]
MLEMTLKLFCLRDLESGAIEYFLFNILEASTLAPLNITDMTSLEETPFFIRASIAKSRDGSIGTPENKSESLMPS